MTETRSDDPSADGRIKSAYEKAMERDDGAAQAPPAAEAAEPAEAPAEAPAPAPAEDYKDKYLRAMADLENFRMRTRREKAQWTAQAVRDMAVSLVDILDNLNLALTTTEANDVANDETFLRGVQAVRDQLRATLAQRGVQAIATQPGDALDPDRHEVLLAQDSPDVQGQVVGMVLRPGYTIGEQVLRPAQIQVLKGPKPPASAS